jgi:putative endonuclease
VYLYHINPIGIVCDSKKLIFLIKPVGLITNKNEKVLYTGITSNLQSRIYEHKTKAHPKSFAAKFNVDRLVYYEEFHSIEEAIAREKQLKAGSRKKKLVLINRFNPEWNDLYEDILKW